MSETVTKARQFAEDAHRGQIDDDGNAHIVHVRRVVQILRQVTEDRELIAAAWLHDVLEDTPATLIQIKEIFGNTIANLVYEVTKVEGKFPHLHSKRAIMLKFADRLQNISRMGVWTWSRQKAYLEKSNFWSASNYSDDVIVGDDEA